MTRAGKLAGLGLLLLLTAVTLELRPGYVLPDRLAAAVGFDCPNYRVNSTGDPPVPEWSEWSAMDWSHAPQLDLWGNPYYQRWLTGGGYHHAEHRSCGPNGLPFDADDVLLGREVMSSAAVLLLKDLPFMLGMVGLTLLVLALTAWLRPHHFGVPREAFFSLAVGLLPGIACAFGSLLFTHLARILCHEFNGPLRFALSLSMTYAVLVAFLCYLVRTPQSCCHAWLKWPVA